MIPALSIVFEVIVVGVIITLFLLVLVYLPSMLAGAVWQQADKLGPFRWLVPLGLIAALGMVSKYEQAGSDVVRTIVLPGTVLAMVGLMLVPASRHKIVQAFHDDFDAIIYRLPRQAKALNEEHRKIADELAEQTIVLMTEKPVLRQYSYYVAEDACFASWAHQHYDQVQSRFKAMAALQKQYQAYSAKYDAIVDQIKGKRYRQYVFVARVDGPILPAPLLTVHINIGHVKNGQTDGSFHDSDPSRNVDLIVARNLLPIVADEKQSLADFRSGVLGWDDDINNLYQFNKGHFYRYGLSEVSSLAAKEGQLSDEMTSTFNAEKLDDIDKHNYFLYVLRLINGDYYVGYQDIAEQTNKKFFAKTIKPVAVGLCYMHHYADYTAQQIEMQVNREVLTLMKQHSFFNVRGGDWGSASPVQRLRMLGYTRYAIAMANYQFDELM